MARSTEGSNHGIPAPPDVQAWRHFGDGLAGRLVAARMQGYDSSTLSYIDVVVSPAGELVATLDSSAVHIGTVDQGAAGASAWKVDGSAVTQPVSAVSLPLPAGAAKDSTLTDGTQRVGGTVAISAASLPLPTNAATDATVGQVRDRLPAAFGAGGGVKVDGSGTALPVSGTFWQTTQPVSAPVGTPVFARLSDGAAALIGQKTMALSLPVTLASDQASVPVAATLAAETSKVIGTVNQGTSPWVTSFSTPQHVIVDSGTDNVTIQNPSLPVTQSGSWALSGTDGLTTQPVTVKAYNGTNKLFVRDEAVLGLLSELLGEIRLLNNNQQEAYD